MDIFEKSIRNGLRWYTTKGNVSIEDVYQLPLKTTNGSTSLDDLAKSLYREIVANGEASFVDDAVGGNTLLELKLDVVKHIIAVKKAENAIAVNAVDIKKQREKIMAAMARNDQTSMDEMSNIDLQKMLDTTK